jgi:hypothetical protein
MPHSKFVESERKSMEKWINFQLPNSYKSIGLSLFIAAFIALIVVKYTVTEPTFLKTIIRQLLVIGLLMISLAKDSIIDEMTNQLRMKSYQWAFLCGVVYAIVQPYIEYSVTALIKNPYVNYTDLSVFQVLVFMLLIQIFSYSFLKRVS